MRYRADSFDKGTDCQIDSAVRSTPFQASEGGARAAFLVEDKIVEDREKRKTLIVAADVVSLMAARPADGHTGVQGMEGRWSGRARLPP